MAYREAAPDETRRFSALFVPWLGEPGVRRALVVEVREGHRTALVCRAGATTPTPRPEAP
ncbi:MAG: hypothetical protein H6721_15975 [Sandaracinus sp.]|nr:hypothetical protein [Sandaracinus sp.]MCB9633615.1 hypothetical protein [Sandaracinus sp.]